MEVNGTTIDMPSFYLRNGFFFFCASFYTIDARPHMRTEDFLFLIFAAWTKNCHRHVNSFSDIPFISLLCSRAKSLKKIFCIQ